MGLLLDIKEPDINNGFNKGNNLTLIKYYYKMKT